MNENKDAKPKLQTLNHILGELTQANDLAFQLERTGKRPGPQTGIDSLDEIIGGFLSPGLHVLQAAPGAGKTAMGLQIASDCGFPCLYVSCEMPAVELFRRLIARTTKTFLGKLRPGQLATETLLKLASRTAETCNGLAVLDCTKAWASTTTLHEMARLLCENFNSPKCLVILDSLQYWARGEDGGAGEYEAINEGLRGLAEVAFALSSPLVVISHRNRQANKTGGGLHSAKGSGLVEYMAETVIDIERDKDVDARGRFNVTLSVHKNRHGETGKEISLFFYGALQNFEER